MNTKENQIHILQKHLSSIRKIAGWTLEELGDKIGVTKQTISNLENNKTKMSLTQYIAIITIINHEIENNENEVLAKVVDILLNRNEEFTDDELKEIDENVKTIAATASGGITGSSLNSLTMNLLGPKLIGPMPVIGGKLLKKLLSKVLNNKKEKEV
jgi:DNA-binding XRE family transcriptional regulator